MKKGPPKAALPLSGISTRLLERHHVAVCCGAPVLAATQVFPPVHRPSSARAMKPSLIAESADERAWRSHSSAFARYLSN